MNFSEPRLLERLFKERPPTKNIGWKLMLFSIHPAYFYQIHSTLVRFRRVTRAEKMER